MKTRILIAVGLMASLASVNAQAKYGMGGCGLGSLIINSPSPSAQSTAALTNGYTYTQVFGITTGTSNCSADSKAGAEIKQQDFFVANFATLSKEIAQGGGDTVSGFAGTLGCDAGRVQAVATQLQANYRDIFAAPGAVAAFDAAKDSLQADADLTAHCAAL